MALTKISEGGVNDDAINKAQIENEAVDAPRLHVSNAGSSGQFLQKQAGSTGGLAWATVDSTPEGTVIKSTGESTAGKFLRTDGDGTCSWITDAGQLTNINPQHISSGDLPNGVLATGIKANTVDESDLKVSNTPTNGQFLSAQSGNTGGLTWADVTVPPAGNTVDLVADGAIAAGKPVIIKSNGKAEQVGISTQASNQLVRNTGSETQQNSHGSTDDHYLERAKKNCVAYNAGNDTMFVLMRTSGHNSSNNQVVAYVYSSDSSNADNLTIQKIEAITAANQSNSGKMCVCALSSNRYFVAYYRSDTDAGVRCKIITIGSNGSTWSAGSEYHIGGTSGASNVDYMSATETTTNRVCILARSNDDSRPTLIIGDITSNNVWNDRRNELISNDASDQPYENQLHYDATDGVLCGIYETNQNNIKLVGMKVAAGTGAAVTVGTIIDITGSSTGGKNSVAFHSASGNWVTAWRDNSSPHTSSYQVHTINSSTLAITSGTAITRSGANAQFGIALSVTAENRVVATYADSNQYIQSEIFTISGTTITSAGAPARVMSNWAQFDRHGSVYMSHNSRMAIFGTRGSSGLFYGTADTTSDSTNFSSDQRNFLGFAENAISDGSSGTISLAGNIVGNQSGLTPGLLYKTNNDGTLTQAWGNGEVGLLAIASDKGQVVRSLQ